MLVLWLGLLHNGQILQAFCKSKKDTCHFHMRRCRSMKDKGGRKSQHSHHLVGMCLVDTESRCHPKIDRTQVYTALTSLTNLHHTPGLYLKRERDPGRTSYDG